MTSQHSLFRPVKLATLLKGKQVDFSSWLTQALFFEKWFLLTLLDNFTGLFIFFP